MKRKIVIDDKLSIEELATIARDLSYYVEISPKALKRVADSHRVLNKLVKEGKTIYGVNTGMGGFVSWLVPNGKSGELQLNLLRAIATNVGSYLSDEEVRAAMLARIVSLSRGHSAISVANLEKYIAIFNAGIIPCVPEQGSLGASGDLGPLAAIALVSVGEWRAKWRGKIVAGAAALKGAKVDPLNLSYKEGLALINGTSAMVGVATLLVEETRALLNLYDVVSALSLETLNAKSKPFDPRVHALKPHPGQQITAQKIYDILRSSKLILNEDKVGKSLQQNKTESASHQPDDIEDAYSLRCTPQIIGPVRDAVEYIAHTVEDELNSSNDNPLIIPDQHTVFHNGHFHGQYIAMAMDQLAIALTTLSNLSDRRVDRFMDETHSKGLPGFLSPNPGLQFGLMGGQFMSTSLTAENRSLCVPISIQTLPSTGDFQDVVSMGLTATRRAKTILRNTKYIIAFEIMCGCQAADFRGAHLLSRKTRQLYEFVRSLVPFFKEDTVMTDYLENLYGLIPLKLSTPG